MTVTGETLGERLERDDAWVDRDVIRRVDDPFAAGGRARGAVRHAGAAGARSSSARPPTPELFETRGPRGRLHLAGGSGRPDRRSGPRRERRTISSCCRMPAPRRAGHAGGRLSADPDEARAAGVKDMVADIRRAHERHGLRHDRPARDAGGGHRAGRSGSCADGDRIRLSGEGAAAGTAGGARRAGTPAGGRGAARRARPGAGLPASLCSSTSFRPTRLRLRFPAIA